MGLKPRSRLWFVLLWGGAVLVVATALLRQFDRSPSRPSAGPAVVDGPGEIASTAAAERLEDASELSPERRQAARLNWVRPSWNVRVLTADGAPSEGAVVGRGNRYTGSFVIDAEWSRTDHAGLAALEQPQVQALGVLGEIAAWHAGHGYGWAGTADASGNYTVHLRPWDAAVVSVVAEDGRAIASAAFTSWSAGRGRLVAAERLPSDPGVCRYRLSGLVAGENLVRVESPDLADSIVTILAGAGVQEQRVLLTPEARLLVTVDAADGAPVEAARLVCETVAWPGTESLPVELGRVTALSGHEALITGLPLGRWFHVRVSGEGLLPTFWPHTMAAANERLSIAVRRSTSLAVEVVDQHGAPLRVGVLAMNLATHGIGTQLLDGLADRAETGSDGVAHLRVPSDVPIGLRVQLDTRMSAVPLATLELPPSPSLSGRVRIIVPNCFRVEGSVATADGQNVPSSVNLNRGDGFTYGAVQSTENTFSFVAPRGSYELVAWSRGMSARAPLELDSDVVVDLVLGPTWSGGGVLQRRDGTPLAAETVVAWRVGGADYGSAVTDKDGRFVLAGLPMRGVPIHLTRGSLLQALGTLRPGSEAGVFVVDETEVALTTWNFETGERTAAPLLVALSRGEHAGESDRVVTSIDEDRKVTLWPGEWTIGPLLPQGRGLSVSLVIPDGQASRHVEVPIVAGRSFAWKRTGPYVHGGMLTATASRHGRSWTSTVRLGAGGVDWLQVPAGTVHLTLRTDDGIEHTTTIVVPD